MPYGTKQFVTRTLCVIAVKIGIGKNNAFGLLNFNCGSCVSTWWTVFVLLSVRWQTKFGLLIPVAL
jgi:hypothetical protein